MKFSKKYSRFDKKTPVLESLFNKVQAYNLCVAVFNPLLMSLYSPKLLSEAATGGVL